MRQTSMAARIAESRACLRLTSPIDNMLTRSDEKTSLSEFCTSSNRSMAYDASRATGSFEPADCLPIAGRLPTQSTHLLRQMGEFSEGLRVGQIHTRGPPESTNRARAFSEGDSWDVPFSLARTARKRQRLGGCAMLRHGLQPS
jgi:hypothetical protein